jgi:predicted deacylase
VGCATQRGIPTLAAEMGMGGWMSGRSVDATRQALLRVLKHLGVLPRVTPPPGVATRWTRIAGAQSYLFAPFDGYFERHFELGDTIVAGQRAGWMHDLSRPDRPPEPVHFAAAGRLYAHGLVSHVRAGQNLAVLIEDAPAP